jgi:ABC-type lipoprotein export system ATPase subunit
VCFAVAIVINKLSHLSDRMCNSCWRRKVRNLFQLFHLVKNSTKEERVQYGVSSWTKRSFRHVNRRFVVHWTCQLVVSPLRRGV